MGNTGPRFKVGYNSTFDCNVLIDTRTGEEVFHDNMEPEDATLVRDLRSLVELLNELADEASRNPIPPVFKTMMTGWKPTRLVWRPDSRPGGAEVSCDTEWGTWRWSTFYGSTNCSGEADSLEHAKQAARESFDWARRAEEASHND